MSLDLGLVYDRTQADVDSAKQIRQSYQALGDWTALTDSERAQLERGTLTYNALNRVEQAVKSIVKQLKTDCLDIEIKETVEWLETDTVTYESWQRYISNVQAIRDAFYSLPGTPELPSADDKLDYIGANTIEKVLADADFLISCMEASYRRCGTFNAGDNAIQLPLKGSA